MDPWIAAAAEEIAARAPDELERLVAISSPSGDVEGAEAALRYALTLVPDGVRVERPPCSTADHADDLVVTLTGTRQRADRPARPRRHRPRPRGPPPARRATARNLAGSGSVDMKGGDILALGVLRALAQRADTFAEVALLLVCDEEWRAGDFAHTRRASRAGTRCLCFEGGQLTGDGEEAVVVKRKAAGTLRVLAHGRSAHSGSAPEKGANALLALASAAQSVAALHDPAGPGAPHRRCRPSCAAATRSTSSPRPASCCATCAPTSSRRSTSSSPGLPEAVDGVRLESEFLRRWPGMDSRAATAPLLDAAAQRLGRPIHGADRGGASDASYLAPVIDVTVDGLGPRGGGAHTPGEYIVESSLRERAEVALALADAVLA